MTFQQVLSEVFARLGLQGVSMVAMVGLVSVVVWSSRARRVGYVAGRAVGTARWVAVSLLLLGLAGVITFHPERVGTLVARGEDVLPAVIEWLRGTIWFRSGLVSWGGMRARIIEHVDIGFFTIALSRIRQSPPAV